jgi:hypothetical protein
LRALGLIAVIALLLSGCMPLRQQKTISGGGDSDLLLCEDRFLLTQLGPSNEPNTRHVVAAESYIIAPRGERYTVEVEPHQFDIEQKYPCVRERIYPVDSRGRRLGRWSNGIWTVHLVLDTPTGRATRHEQIRFWTFWYNPLFHGPPN